MAFGTPPNFDEISTTMTLLMLGVPGPLALEIAQGVPFLNLSLGQLSLGLNEQYRQSPIFCPLFGPTDVLSLIEVLNDSPFSGKLTIILPSLPNAKMVASELRSAARSSLNLEVLPL